MHNGNRDAEALDRAFLRLKTLAKQPVDLCLEVVRGFRAGTLPRSGCYLAGALMAWAIVFGGDRYLFQRAGAARFYPSRPITRAVYLGGLETCGFWLWGALQLGRRRRLLGRLTTVLTSAGLKNAFGNFPGFVFDQPLGGGTRCLRLTRALLAHEKFVAAKPVLESGLQVYIDELRDNLEAGTVDILYSLTPMPTLTPAPDLAQLGSGVFVVGTARAGSISASLRDVPHILVAGETSSGKSTYLRQVITGLYLSNKGYEFTLIDLKGGLEFSLFSGVQRVDVVATLRDAAQILHDLDGELERRLSLFASAGVKDLDAFAKKGAGAASGAETLSRHVVVIDEIAEMFLAGDGKPVKEVQRARAAVSRLARQGRAVGLHLVLGTQRPDARALDTQIKANLTGKVCFQMADTPSSMVVLGNARARDLPAVPGRAIWQRGLKMTEVQTPYLDPADAEALLAPFREAKSITPPPTAFKENEHFEIREA